jgi:hypothetical protein
MDWFLKGVFVIIFAPVLIGLAVQAVLVLIAVVLPYVLALAAIVGITAGLTAGFVLRRRLPPPSRGGNYELPIPPPEAVRRPRGPRRPQD